MLPRISPQTPIPNSDCGHPSWARVTTRILGIIHILYSLEVGIALLLLPWMGVWEHNMVLYLYPQIGPVVTNPFFKGAVLGLGIDNILIGFHEVLHFKDSPGGFFS